MSWELAVLAASAASAAAQYTATTRQAKAGAQASRIKAETAQTNKSMAELQALDQEVDRIQEFNRLMSSNLNSVGYDPYSSPSYLAIEGESRSEQKGDIDRIRLLGKTKADNFQNASDIAKIEGDAFKSMGRTAWLQPAGTVLMGAYKANRITTPRGTVT
tara:strand:+ start:105 stop:584 length:480 start_codon:yes stop_codon:yes gene_type:complete